jgi:hypothetical protein
MVLAFDLSRNFFVRKSYVKQHRFNSAHNSTYLTKWHHTHPEVAEEAAAALEATEEADEAEDVAVLEATEEDEVVEVCEDFLDDELQRQRMVCYCSALELGMIWNTFDHLEHYAKLHHLFDMNCTG